MEPVRKKIPGASVYKAIIFVLFFCCFFLYFWLYGNTRLIYHAFGRFVDYPLFFTGWKFFGDSIDHPGGLVEYVTGFMSQFYYYPVGGAIVITIIISLTCLAVEMIFSFAGFNFLAGIAGYTPAIFFLAMHNRCEHPLGYFIALLINLWALIAYQKISLKTFASRCCLFAIMFVLLYLAAGAYAFVFGILAAGFEMFIRRRFLSGGLFILLTGLLPLPVGWYFDMRLTDIYLYSLPINTILSLDDKTSAKWLYISVLCILLGVFVCQFFFSRKTSEKTSGKQAGKKSKKAKVPKIRLGWIVQPLVIITAAVAAVSLFSDDIKKQHLQADFYAANGMWTEFLEYANRYPVVANDPVGNHYIIRALYHSGRLGEDLFSYPQFVEGMFLPPKKGQNVRRFRRGISFIRLSLLLGRVNVAEKEAYEVLENSGEYPELLWTLAIINVAKGQPETAKVFLNVLSRDLIHGKKAKSMLKQLNDDPELSNDDQVNGIRSVMLRKDVTGDQSLEEVMSDLLEENPHNKLAFEYLMIYYLKGKRVDKIAENIYRFADFGYKKIPRDFAEAITIHLINISKTGGRIESHGWQVDPKTTNTARQFMAALKFNPVSNPLSARNLAPKFGNTYFYYYMFNKSGVGR